MLQAIKHTFIFHFLFVYKLKYTNTLNDEWRGSISRTGTALFVVVEDVAMQMERAVAGSAFLADCFVVPLYIIVQLVVLILLRIGNVKLSAADAGAVYFHHLIVVL